MFLLLICINDPPDGTTIFLTRLGKQSILAKKIEEATGDNISHVAIILYEENEPYVYESIVPGGVQRNKLDKYIKKINHLKSKKPTQGIQIYLIPPNPDYTTNELTKMKDYANSQLGRPYMMRGWWKNKEVKGMHCSQYIGNIISKSDKIYSFNYKESPASLYEKLYLIDRQEEFLR